MRNSNECTSTWNQRPDYGFLLNNICPFRGEETGGKIKKKGDIRQAVLGLQPNPFHVRLLRNRSTVHLSCDNPPPNPNIPNDKPVVHDIVTADQYCTIELVGRSVIKTFNTQDYCQRVESLKHLYNFLGEK